MPLFKELRDLFVTVAGCTWRYFSREPGSTATERRCEEELHAESCLSMLRVSSVNQRDHNNAFFTICCASLTIKSRCD